MYYVTLEIMPTLEVSQFIPDLRKMVRSGNLVLKTVFVFPPYDKSHRTVLLKPRIVQDQIILFFFLDVGLGFE